MGEREWEATLNQGDSPHSLTLVYAPLPLQTLSPDCNTTRKILKYYCSRQKLSVATAIYVMYLGNYCVGLSDVNR